MLRQHAHNVAWTLSQHWSPMLGTKVAPTFTHHCLKIASLLSMSPNIGTTLCGNIGILVRIQCWYNVHRMLSGCPHNVAGVFEISTNEHCHNVDDRHWDNIGTNVVTTLPQHWSVTWVPSVWLNSIGMKPIWTTVSDGSHSEILLQKARKHKPIPNGKLNVSFSNFWNERVTISGAKQLRLWSHDATAVFHLGEIRNRCLVYITCWLVLGWSYD